ncbi:MAG: NAD(P)-dependent oxidoreductase [Sphaerobacteraceae bacterium]|nr:MAG: NAD(P)-dependent oxidoreductase [Sphaerobacteraceae bacterium]
MAQRRKRVLITGAAGRIGMDMTRLLGDRYDLRLQFHNTVPEKPATDDYVVADIAEYDQIAPAMEGIDAVLHLAGEPAVTTPWDRVNRANIEGLYNVYESARQAGVQRVVFASTNHVMGMNDRDEAWPVYSRQPVRPDSLYGVSKAFGETLGRHYYDRYGMSFINMRIGAYNDRPRDEIARYMWLSPRDFAQLVWRSIESDVGFATYYAISGNTSRTWDITDAVVQLGYIPEDNADDHLPPRNHRIG